MVKEEPQPVATSAANTSPAPTRERILIEISMADLLRSRLVSRLACGPGRRTQLWDTLPKTLPRETATALFGGLCRMRCRNARWSSFEIARPCGRAIERHSVRCLQPLGVHIREDRSTPFARWCFTVECDKLRPRAATFSDPATKTAATTPTPREATKDDLGPTSGPPIARCRRRSISCESTVAPRRSSASACGCRYQPNGSSAPRREPGERLLWVYRSLPAVSLSVLISVMFCNGEHLGRGGQGTSPSVAPTVAASAPATKRALDTRRYIERNPPTSRP